MDEMPTARPSNVVAPQSAAVGHWGVGTGGHSAEAWERYVPLPPPLIKNAEACVEQG